MARYNRDRPVGNAGPGERGPEAMTRAVIFDVGRVLIEWDIFALYRKLLPNDEEIVAFIDEVGLA